MAAVGWVSVSDRRSIDALNVASAYDS
jgi:hypothetical protein